MPAPLNGNANGNLNFGVGNGNLNGNANVGILNGNLNGNANAGSTATWAFSTATGTATPTNRLIFTGGE